MENGYFCGIKLLTMEMYRFIGDFPRNVGDAVEASKSLGLKQAQNTINNVVITGLGGSGIGGKIVSDIVSGSAACPILINNDYTLPAFVNENTLVIACSYSGNTEETLTAVGTAIEKGAEIACLTSGGKLKELAESNGFNLVVVPGGNPPRTTLGTTSPRLFAILKHYGIIDDRYDASLDKVSGYLKQHEFEIQTKAQLMAEGLYTFTPVIYSDAGYEGVAIRLRQQLNENSKILCWHHVFPEMNHNELVGWVSGNEKIAVIMIRTDDDPERTQTRMDLSLNIFEKYTQHITEVHAKGDDKVIRTYYLIHFIDWLSLYLSEQYGVDSIEIDVIDYLKGELAKK